MDSPEIIESYFPNLTDLQRQQFQMLGKLYADWNSRINVISRKDIEFLYRRHVLHSLGIARVCSFSEHDSVLDIGTGGGFPGIPLAILNPDTPFMLIDSVGKKIRVVREISASLGLNNLNTEIIRAEDHKECYHFIVSRAVTRIDRFLRWTKGRIHKASNSDLRNGILYLKGGDLSEELAGIKKDYTLYSLSEFFSGEFFETKKVLYIPN